MSYLKLIITLKKCQIAFLGDLDVVDLIGDDLPPLDGELDVGDSIPLIGDDSLNSFPTNVFYIATLSENFFNGSFLSNFSNSAGVY